MTGDTSPATPSGWDTLCGAVSADGTTMCAFPPNHSGGHGWEQVDPHDELAKLITEPFFWYLPEGMTAGKIADAGRAAVQSVACSDWLRRRDAKVKTEALREAARRIYNGCDRQDLYNEGVNPWLEGLAFEIETAQEVHRG